MTADILLDADLNDIGNGVIDLRTGKAFAPDPLTYISKAIPAPLPPTPRRRRGARSWTAASTATSR